MKDLFPKSLAGQVALFAVLLPVWFFVTAGYGAVAVWKIVAWFRGRHRRGLEVTRCGRGHEVPLYGVYECACGSIHEGQVFRPCRVCSETCGWTPCPECGLPVQNPGLV